MSLRYVVATTTPSHDRQSLSTYRKLGEVIAAKRDVATRVANSRFGRGALVLTPREWDWLVGARS